VRAIATVIESDGFGAEPATAADLDAIYARVRQRTG
jgi:hypothetical protein